MLYYKLYLFPRPVCLDCKTILHLYSKCKMNDVTTLYSIP